MFHRSAGLTGIFIASLIASLSLSLGSEAETARGLVYHDVNENGRFDAGDRGLEGFHVSNGEDVATTNGDGRYELTVDDDTILFVIRPKGWRTPYNDNGIPKFFYVHNPAGSSDANYRHKGVKPTGALPASIDFPLYPDAAPESFTMICFGDTQPRNQQEVDYIGHDVIEELIGSQEPLGTTLGDVVFNDLSMLEPLQKLVGRLGVPWYNVHGNHDVNQEALDDGSSDETWARIYGPTWYAFEYGDVAFLVLDDIAWDGGGYHGEFGARQRRFIKNYLDTVPREKLIVAMMHIPVISCTDKEEFFDLIEDRPNTLSLSSHWHRQAHFFLDEEDGWNGAEPHHHLVTGTVCGSWWSGAKDETGIPHATMSDGTPNGYSYITFDGAAYSVAYKVARRPADFQMNIYAPEVIRAEDATATDIVVNVFAGSERSTVEMQAAPGAPWVPMLHTSRVDPYFAELKAFEDKLPPEAGRKLPNANQSTHIWVGNLPSDLPSGVHTLRVRTTDMFGHTYEATRILRVE